MSDGVVMQEFYCRHCRNGEGGFITIRLHTGWNRHVRIHCPGDSCEEMHSRTIKDGIIYEYASISGGYETEEIYLPRSAWSAEPRTTAMYRAAEELKLKRKKESSSTPHQVKQLREGAPIRENSDLIIESWLDRYYDNHKEAQ